MAKDIYFNEEGKAIDGDQWLRVIHKNKFQKKTELLPEKILVSTVFLGIAYGKNEKGQPLIYETMVFSKSGESLEYQRYASKMEALVGHDEMCAKWEERQ